MAKKSVNVVERHAEKAVLGICVAALLAAIVLFGVSTPSKIEIDAQKVGPDRIDQVVLDAAHNLRDKLRRAQAEPAETEDPLPKFEEASSPLAYAHIDPSLPAPVPMLPRVPAAFGGVPMAGEIELARVIPPSKPIHTHDRATVNLVPPVTLPAKDQGIAATGTSVPQYQWAVNWVTVAAKFDQQEQRLVFRSAGYQAARQIPYVLGVDLQRRERMPDGSYGEWKDVKPYLPAALPSAPEVELVLGQAGVTIPTKESDEALRAYFSLVKRVQSDLMRPLFAKVVYGTDWLYPKFDDVNIHELDLEVCVADEKNDCPPRPYPFQRDVETAKSDAEKTDDEIITEKFWAAEVALKRCQWEEVSQIINKLEDDLKQRDKTLRGEQKTKAEQLRFEAKQGEQDQKRGRKTPCEAPEEEDTTLSLRQSRYQVVWAHDAADEFDGGAQSGKTYQYRMRLQLYNRYVGISSALKNDEDAQEIKLLGEWSEPTEDVYIEPDAAFFLTSGSTNTQSGAKVTVYKWMEGVWVDERFPVVVGDRLKGSAHKVVRILENGEEDRPLVDFDTGSTVVDLDYNYNFRPTKLRGKEGLTLAPPTQTVSLVFVDEQSGELRQRILEADRNSEQYKTFKERAFNPRSTRR